MKGVILSREIGIHLDPSGRAPWRRQWDGLSEEGMERMATLIEELTSCSVEDFGGHSLDDPRFDGACAMEVLIPIRNERKALEAVFMSKENSPDKAIRMLDALAIECVLDAFVEVDALNKVVTTGLTQEEASELGPEFIKVTPSFGSTAIYPSAESTVTLGVPDGQHRVKAELPSWYGEMMLQHFRRTMEQRKP